MMMNFRKQIIISKKFDEIKNIIFRSIIGQSSYNFLFFPFSSTLKPELEKYEFMMISFVGPTSILMKTIGPLRGLLLLLLLILLLYSLGLSYNRKSICLTLLTNDK